MFSEKDVSSETKQDEDEWKEAGLFPVGDGADEPVTDPVLIQEIKESN